MSEIILRLPAKTIGNLISELNALQDRVRSGENLEIPSVTLFLNSGQNLSGKVTRILHPPSQPPSLASSMASEATVLLQHKVNAMDLSYVSLSSIQSVTVHHTSSSLVLLSDGKIRANADKVPSRLELERLTRTVSGKFAEIGLTIDLIVLWDELPKSSAALQSLEILLQDLQAVLLAITTDEIGLSSLRAKVNIIKIGIDVTTNIRLRENILEIRLKTEEQDLIWMSRIELRKSLEKLL